MTPAPIAFYIPHEEVEKHETNCPEIDKWNPERNIE
jgi:hypothetical protein